MLFPERLYTHMVFVAVGVCENTVSIFTVSVLKLSSMEGSVVNDSSSLQAPMSRVARRAVRHVKSVYVCFILSFLSLSYNAKSTFLVFSCLNPCATMWVRCLTLARAITQTRLLPMGRSLVAYTLL